MATTSLKFLPCAVLALTTSAVAQCIVPTGTSLMLNGVLADDWTGPVAIGFAFPFAGSTYTDMWISDHGLVCLNNAGVPAAPPNGPFVYDPEISKLSQGGGPLLSPYWSDHSMTYFGSGTNDGEIWVDSASGTTCTVTWADVETYIDGNPFTFQMVLHANGFVDFRYDERVCNDGSTFATLASLTAIVGMSTVNAPTPAPSDLSTGPLSLVNEINEVFVTTAPLTCNPNFDLAGTMLTFVPSNPGWVVLPSSLDCATVEFYGNGCDGLSMDATRPEIGTSWDLTVNGLSMISPIAVFFIGTGSTNPGLPLTAIGINAPGCEALLSNILVSASAPAAMGSATLGIPLPNNMALIGSVLTSQGLGLTLNTPSNLATSDAVEGTIGN